MVCKCAFGDFFIFLVPCYKIFSGAVGRELLAAETTAGCREFVRKMDQPAEVNLFQPGRSPKGSPTAGGAGTIGAMDINQRIVAGMKTAASVAIAAHAAAWAAPSSVKAVTDEKSWWKSPPSTLWFL